MISSQRQEAARLRTERQRAILSQALEMKRKGYTNVEIARRLGISESTVRHYIR